MAAIPYMAAAALVSAGCFVFVTNKNESFQSVCGIVMATVATISVMVYTRADIEHQTLDQRWRMSQFSQELRAELARKPPTSFSQFAARIFDD